ncbi:MAG: alpha/beta hydrolase [Thermoleophilaceae bacterium]|nr:alpha/beta hydrolase [Thermoleophilaceae bacterium]
MSSLTGFRRADGQRLSPHLALLAGPSTVTLNFAARHPTSMARKVVDLAFGVMAAPYAKDTLARELWVDGADGQLAAALYEPAGLGPDAGLLVYFHGGGWVLGGIASHANSCRFLAKRAASKVLAVEYRKAPEHRFPAAQEDCLAAYRWAVREAATLGVDPGRIAVGGDSAGGNLAASVALSLAPGDQKPCMALLIYPVVDADISAYPSAQLFAAGPILSRQGMIDMVHHYAPGARAQLDPRMTLFESDALAQMPPTFIATAGMDPLRDQGERFADRLREAGAEVESRRFENLPHGFSLLLIDPDSRRAAEECARAVGRGLSRAPAAPARA